MTLAEQIEKAKAESRDGGYCVMFSGPAAEAAVRGTMDGCEGRPSRLEEYRTAPEREAYAYKYADSYRPARDRKGCTYDVALF